MKQCIYTSQNLNVTSGSQALTTTRTASGVPCTNQDKGKEIHSRRLLEVFGGSPELQPNVQRLSDSAHNLYGKFSVFIQQKEQIADDVFFSFIKFHRRVGIKNEFLPGAFYLMKDFHTEIPVGHLGLSLCQRFTIVDITFPALETQRTQGLGAFEAN